MRPALVAAIAAVERSRRRDRKPKPRPGSPAAPRQVYRPNARP
jgi:hypothetical protein